MKQIFMLVAAAPLLAGCAVAAKMEARNDYKASADQYKACLTANPSAPQNCEGLRLAMETDERKFNNMGAAMDPGAQRSQNVTILNR
jgi:hypothetical protein